MPAAQQGGGAVEQAGSMFETAATWVGYGVIFFVFCGAMGLLNIWVQDRIFGDHGN